MGENTKEQAFDWITLPEVAELINAKSAKSIYMYVEEYGLPAYRIGGSYKFNRPEVIDWIKQQKITKA